MHTYLAFVKTPADHFYRPVTIATDEPIDLAALDVAENFVKVKELIKKKLNETKNIDVTSFVEV